jgi:hypothetical protein
LRSRRKSAEHHYKVVGQRRWPLGMPGGPRSRALKCRPDTCLSAARHLPLAPARPGLFLATYFRLPSTSGSPGGMSRGGETKSRPARLRFQPAASNQRAVGPRTCSRVPSGFARWGTRDEGKYIICRCLLCSILLGTLIPHGATYPDLSLINLANVYPVLSSPRKVPGSYAPPCNEHDI